MDLIICPSKDKGFLAGEGRILIDDREQNIKDWENAGGVGIHHKGNFDETLKALQVILAQEKEMQQGIKPTKNSLKSPRR